MDDNALVITPTNQSFSLKAGETESGSLKIINPATSKSNLRYKIQVVPYSVSGDGYELDLTSETERTKLAKWLRFDATEGEIAPGDLVEANFSIVVPEAAPTGGQYAAIIVTALTDQPTAEGSAGVAKISELASILYATVDGEIVHGGEIVSNNVPLLLTTPYLSTNIVLENTGNVHELAMVKLDISNYLNGETLYSIGGKETDLADVIMPETTRSLEKEVSSLPSPAVLTVKQTVEYLGQTSVTEKHVFICPVWLLLLATLIVCSLITFIVLRLRRCFSHKPVSL